MHTGLAKSDEKIEEAKRDVAEANRQAEIALLKQEEIRKENIKLSTRLNESIAESRSKQTELAEAQERLAGTQGELAEAQRKQAEAEGHLRLTLEDVHKRQQPRSLTAIERRKLIELLRGGAGSHIDIYSTIGVDDGAAYAEQIAEVFRLAGWQTEGARQNNITVTQIGINLFVNDAANAPPSAKILLNAFKDVGVNVRGVENKSFPAGTLTLWIGSKELAPSI